MFSSVEAAFYRSLLLFLKNIFNYFSQCLRGFQRYLQKFLPFFSHI